MILALWWEEGLPMRTALQITLLAMLLAGCAAPQPMHTQIQPPLEVPSTAIVASRQKSLNAYHVLSGSDTPDFFYR